MTKNVVDMWWEGPNLFVETDDGQTNMYEGAYISDVDHNYGEDSGVIVEKCTVKAEDLPKYLFKIGSTEVTVGNFKVRAESSVPSFSASDFEVKK